MKNLQDVESSISQSSFLSGLAMEPSVKEMLVEEWCALEEEDEREMTLEEVVRRVMEPAQLREMKAQA
jgi:hypothetical protein